MTPFERKLCGIALLVFSAALLTTGLHQLLAQDEYRATARIKVEVSSTPGSSTPPFHPYFVRSEIDVFQSDQVLSNVVEKLNLRHQWAGGDKVLPARDAISLLKQKARVQQVGTTPILAIDVETNDPKEAAAIANTMVEAYREYHLQAGASTTAPPTYPIQIQIVDQAVAATHPSYPNRRQGIAMAVAGLLLGLGGLYLVRDRT